LIPLTAVLVYWNIFESYSIVNQLPVVPALVREVGVRGLLAVGLILLYTQYFSFDWYVRSIVLTYVFALVATLLYLKSKNILFLKPSRSFFAHHRINDMMVYGGFVLMGNASGAIIANIDGLMVSAYSGLKSTGVYTIAFFIAQVVEIPKRSLSQVLVPLVSEANKNNDIPKLRELYKKSSINQLIMGGSIFLCVWCNIENIFQLIPNGHLYVAGKWVVFYIGLAKLFDMATGINSEIIGTSKYYKFDLVFYIFLSIVGIVANVILIPLLGITGAAIASAISVFLFNTARFIFIAKLFTMQPFSFSTVVVIMLGVAVIVGNVFMPEIGYPLINIFVRSILILSVFLGGAVFFNTSDEINDIMSKVRIRIKMVLGSR
jgi:O-antigen/teichoic acid export membrane protein